MRFSLPFYRTPPRRSETHSSNLPSISSVQLNDISSTHHITAPTEPTDIDTITLGQPPGYHEDEYYTLELGSLDAWLRNVTHLQAQVGQLSDKVNQLEKIHRLCASNEEEQGHWTIANGLSLSIQQKLFNVHEKISNMDTLKSQFDISEQHIATIQEKGLLHSLIFVASRYKRAQALHKETCNDHLAKLIKPWWPESTETERTSWAQGQSHHSRRLSEWISDTNKLQQIRNRQAEVQHLESSVNELNALVQDLNQLLQSQDANLQATQDYVEVVERQLDEGSRDIEEAERYASKIQWSKVVSGFVVLFVICGIVGLVLAISLPNSTRTR